MNRIQAKCPYCNQNVYVEEKNEASICSYCKKPFITEKAIQMSDAFISQGNCELKRLFKRAETLKGIGEYNKAGDVYRKITEMYPEDYRGWLNLIPFTGGEKRIRNIKIVEKLCDEDDVKKELYKIMIYSLETQECGRPYTREEWCYYEKYCGEYLNVCTEQADNFMKEYPEQVLKTALLDIGMSYMSKEFIFMHCNAVQLKHSANNLYLPCIINNQLFWNVTADVIWSDGYDLSSWINCKRIQATSLDIIRNKASEWLEIHKRKREGLCLYCGGKRSIFTGKCKKCGRKECWE